MSATPIAGTAPQLLLLGPDHAVGRLRDQLAGCRALPTDLQLLTGPGSEAPLRLELTGSGWQLSRASGEALADAFPDDVLDLQTAARLRYSLAGSEALPESWRSRGRQGTPASQAALARALRWGLLSLCESICAALWQLPPGEPAAADGEAPAFEYPFASAASEIFEQVLTALGDTFGSEPRPLPEKICAALREQSLARIVAAWLAHHEQCTRGRRAREGHELHRAGTAVRTLVARTHARLLPRGAALPERGAGWRPRDDAAFQALLSDCLRPRLIAAGKAALEALADLAGALAGETLL